MKTFKLTDIIISIVLIAGAFVYSMLQSFDGFAVINSYFVIGCWQVISMIIHQADKRFAGKETLRFRYHVFVLALLLFFAVMIGLELLFDVGSSVFMLPFFAVLMVLVVASPVLAIFYTNLCIREWKKMETYPDTNNQRA